MTKQEQNEKRLKDQQRIERKKQIDKLRETVELEELKARKWKAEYENMYFSMEVEKLQDPYNEWIKRHYQIQEPSILEPENSGQKETTNDNLKDESNGEN